VGRILRGPWIEVSLCIQPFSIPSAIERKTSDSQVTRVMMKREIKDMREEEISPFFGMM
jgi:hypothetical protein